MRTIFAKQNTRNVEHEAGSQVIKAKQGHNDGIPDFSRRRINDGALRANHRGLFEAARMVNSQLQ